MAKICSSSSGIVVLPGRRREGNLLILGPRAGKGTGILILVFGRSGAGKGILLILGPRTGKGTGILLLFQTAGNGNGKFLGNLQYFAPESEKELTSLQNLAGHARWLVALVQQDAQASKP